MTSKVTMKSVVYDPPKEGFPYLAVLFDTKGEVLAARAMPSADIAENFILTTAKDIAELHGLKATVKK